MDSFSSFILIFYHLKFVSLDSLYLSSFFFLHVILGILCPLSNFFELQFSIFLTFLLIPHLFRCPYHFNNSLSRLFAIFATPRTFLLFLCWMISLKVCLFIHRSLCIFTLPIFLQWAFLKLQHTNPYTSVSLMTVRYNLHFSFGGPPRSHNI